MDKLNLTKEQVEKVRAEYEYSGQPVSDYIFDWLTLEAENKRLTERLEKAGAIINGCETILSNPLNDLELCEMIVSIREWKEEQK